MMARNCNRSWLTCAGFLLWFCSNASGRGLPQCSRDKNQNSGAGSAVKPGENQQQIVLPDESALSKIDFSNRSEARVDGVQ